MSDFYKDTDTGSDAADGTTWANAKLTHEGLLAVMSAGDTGFTQGAAADTAAASRTFTAPVVCKIVGVVNGTTNEPPVLADLAVTLPVISATGSASDIFYTGKCTAINIHFSAEDKNVFPTSGDELVVINGKFSGGDDIGSSSGFQSRLMLINSVFETLGTLGRWHGVRGGMLGGSVLFTAASSLLDTASSARDTLEFRAVDLSGLTASFGGDSDNITAKVVNCKMPSSFTLYTSVPVLGSVELIACNDTSSESAGDSIQDYMYEDAYGTIDLELTAVRTGGADDDATGAFSYAMTPRASATLEGSDATLKSPWMSVWLDGGSNTVTIHIANDSASTDYNEDEVWTEFYTPDAGDTAQYDQTFDPASARLFASSTAVTDDTGSSWGTGANNHQKMSVTVTTGYTGWAYMRLHLAKRSATPDTLFLDPKPVVS